MHCDIPLTFDFSTLKISYRQYLQYFLKVKLFFQRILKFPHRQPNPNVQNMAFICTSAYCSVNQIENSYIFIEKQQ